jgi:hypothetical protein
MNFEEYNEDYGRNEFGNQLEKDVTQMSALQSFLLGNELTKEEVPFIQEFKCVKDFLDLPLNDSKEADLKKLFATAITIACEKGVLPFPMEDKSPLAIASIVDEGLTRLKVAYQTSIGTIDVIEAADALIDRLAVRVVVAVDKAIERGVPMLLDRLCGAMVSVFPQTASLVPVIKSLEKYITPIAKVTARKGIQVIADTAKVVVRKVADKAKQVAKKISNFLKA